MAPVWRSWLFGAAAAAVIALSADPAHAQLEVNSNSGLKVEQVKKEVEAVKCGDAVLVNYHTKLVQAPPPTGENPETCENFKMTMANLTEIHKVWKMRSVRFF